MMCDIVDLHAPELLPEIKALYETGVIYEGTAGSFKSVERDIKKREFTNPLELHSFNAIDRFKDMRHLYDD